MKIFFNLLTLLLLCCGTISAQSADPAISGAIFTPNTIKTGETATLNFSFSNSGFSEIPANSIEITIVSASNFYTTDGTTGPTGDGGDLFTWSYIPQGDIWRGTNTAGIAAFGGGEVNLVMFGNTVSASFETTNINVQPVANLNSFANESSNDNEQPSLKIDQGTSIPCEAVGGVGAACVDANGNDSTIGTDCGCIDLGPCLTAGGVGTACLDAYGNSSTIGMDCGCIDLGPCLAAGGIGAACTDINGKASTIGADCNCIEVIPSCTVGAACTDSDGDASVLGADCNCIEVVPSCTVGAACTDSDGDASVLGADCNCIEVVLDCTVGAACIDSDGDASVFDAKCDCIEIVVSTDRFADPAVTGANFSPNQVQLGNKSTLTASFANTGSTAIPPNSIELTISTPSSFYNTDGTTIPSGAGGDLFNWTYISSAATWRGINIGSIAAFGGGDIVLEVMGMALSDFETTNINVQPVANLNAFANEVSNDNLQPTLKVIPVPIDCGTEAPVITLVSATPPTCAGGNDGRLEVAVSYTHAPGAEQWVAGPASRIWSGLTAGTYTFAAFDLQSCSTSVSFTLEDPAVVPTPILAGVPADVTVSCEAIPAPATVTSGSLAVDFSEVRTGTDDCNYKLTRTWTVIADCGSSASATQMITVVDETAPVLVGVPADITINVNNLESLPLVNVTVSDNCDTGVEVLYEQSIIISDGCSNTVSYIEDWAAIDNCDNVVSASRSVTIIDDTYLIDADGDGICDDDDICAGGDDTMDGDGDGIPDFCDTCDGGLAGKPCEDGNACTIGDVYDAACNCVSGPLADADGDGVCDADDICPGGNDTMDGDGDGIPDFCDTCDGGLAGKPCEDGNACTIGDVYDAACNCISGPLADDDGDGVCNDDDICAGGDDTMDGDGDGTPDYCDACPMDANKIAAGACGCGVADTDTDGNGVLDCNEPVCDNVTSGGRVGFGSNCTYVPTICGSTVRPLIGSCALPSGGSGAIEYIWLMSTTCPNRPPNSITTDPEWTAVPNSNSPTLQLPNLVETTCYIRCSRRVNCDDYVGESNIVKVIVDPSTCPVTCDLGIALTTKVDPNCMDRDNGALGVTVSNGTAPYTYAWSNGATGSAQITRLVAGSYTVSATDANGCMISGTYTLDTPTPITVVETVTQATCGQMNGAISLAVSGGTGAYTYIWNGQLSTANRTNLAPGTYTVIIRDGVDCEQVNQYTIENVTTADCGDEGEIQVNTCNFEVRYTSNSVAYEGNVAKVVIFRGFNERQNIIYECQGDCPTSEVIANIPAGNYGVKIFNHDYSCVFDQRFISIGGGSNCTDAGKPCDDGNACTVGDVYDADCNCISGIWSDADGDGVCNADDICPGGNDNIDTDGDGIPDACDTNNCTDAGKPCDDGIACTIGDVYDADCNCISGALADGDGDGICDADDCAPNNGNLPAQTANVPCVKDGKSGFYAMNTCDCVVETGEVLATDCNIEIIQSNGALTLNGPFRRVYISRGYYNNNAIIFACDGDCPDSQVLTGLEPGQYTIKVWDNNWCIYDNPKIVIEAGTSCTDTDGDGVCDADDICAAGDDNMDTDGDGIPDACDTNTCPNVGATCDDGDSTTGGDVIGDDCICAGTPILTGDVCADVMVEGADGKIIVSNLNAFYTKVRIFRAVGDNGGYVYPQLNGCEGNCAINEEFLMASGTYVVEIDLLNANYGLMCPPISRIVTVTGSSASDRNIEEDFNLKVFPNPAEEEVFVNLSEWTDKTVDMTIYNHFSQVVYERHIEKVDQHLQRVDLKNFTNGIYYIQIEAGNRRPVTKKIMVARLY